MILKILTLLQIFISFILMLSSIEASKKLKPYCGPKTKDIRFCQYD